MLNYLVGVTVVTGCLFAGGLWLAIGNEVAGDRRLAHPVMALEEGPSRFDWRGSLIRLQQALSTRPRGMHAGLDQLASEMEANLDELAIWSAKAFSRIPSAWIDVIYVETSPTAGAPHARFSNGWASEILSTRTDHRKGGYQLFGFDGIRGDAVTLSSLVADVRAHAASTGRAIPAEMLEASLLTQADESALFRLLRDYPSAAVFGLGDSELLFETFEATYKNSRATAYKDLHDAVQDNSTQYGLGRTLTRLKESGASKAVMVVYLRRQDVLTPMIDEIGVRSRVYVTVHIDPRTGQEYPRTRILFWDALEHVWDRVTGEN
jgi:hypothetical protein